MNVLRHLQKFGHDGGTCDLDKNDVIQAYAIEGIQEGKLALYLVGLDHGLEYVTDSQHLALARQVICDRKDGTQVVRRVPPLCREPAVVEVEPPNLRADVEGAANRIDLEARSRNLGA